MIEGYKDSPLGKIPNDWDVDKIGNRTTSFAGGTPKRGVEGYYGGSIPWIKSGEVNNNSIEGSEEHVTELAIKESSAKLIEANSILVALYGATAGKVGVLKVKACSNQAVLAITSKNETLTNQFLYHYLKKCTTELLNLCQGSGQPNLSKGIVDGVFLPLPPLPEQQKIAEILSTVDAKIEVIDQQITETQALKKGLMQRLLTKGIGHTEFKDSALGEIPKSWEVLCLGDIAKINMGQSPSSTSYNDKGIGEYLIQGNADIKNRKSMPRQWTTEPTKLCNIGDILMTVRAPVGAVAKSRHQACIGRGVCSITSKSVETEFLYQFLLSYESKWKALEQGSTFTAVNGNDIKGVQLLVPSYKEQSQISEVLSSVDEKLEVLTEKKTHYQELKQGLMQQLLTGKIRVNL